MSHGAVEECRSNATARLVIKLEIKVSYFFREKPYACSNLMSCATTDGIEQD